MVRCAPQLSVVDVAYRVATTSHKFPHRCSGSLGFAGVRQHGGKGCPRACLYDGVIGSTVLISTTAESPPEGHIPVSPDPLFASARQQLAMRSRIPIMVYIYHRMSVAFRLPESET